MARGIENTIGKLLSSKKKTLAIAESCSGGGLSNILTNIPGSSTYFLGAVVAYSNQAKMNVLNIPEKIIQEDGAVSKNCAVSMAQNVRSLLHSDIGLSVTGVAGPSGGSMQKPVGTVFIAISNGGKSVCKMFKFEGDRLDIKQKSIQAALKMVKEFIG